MKRQIQSNSIKGELLNEVKLKVAKSLYEILVNTYGPYGNKTMIGIGNEFKSTKDGKEVLINIRLDGQVEQFILNEFKDMARFMEKNVGDATTTVALLSTMILDKLLKSEVIKELPTRKIKEALKKISEECTEAITGKSKEITPELAYHIAYVCSDGDEHLSDIIESLFKEYGNNISLEAVTANRPNEINRINGIELDARPLNSCFFNNSNGTCELTNVNIAFFSNMVDNDDMIMAMNDIIKCNIADDKNPMINPAFKNVGDVLIILEKGLNKDAEAILDPLFKQFNLMENAIKPRFCIVELRTTGMLIKEEIKKLTGALNIHKALQQDQPLDNSFPSTYHKMGFAKRVVISGSKMIFEDCLNHTSLSKNLSKAHFDFASSSLKLQHYNQFTDVDEVQVKRIEKVTEEYKNNYTEALEVYQNRTDDKNKYHDCFDQIIENIKVRITEEENRENSDKLQVIMLKNMLKRLTTDLIQISLKVNNLSDINGQQNMLDDVVTSINSASKNGVGYASMTELYSFFRGYKTEDGEPTVEIAKIIKTSIEELLKNLWGTNGDSEEVITKRFEEFKNKEELVPYNIVTNEFDDKLLTTITSDSYIMETISSILINLMTTNQLLVDLPGLAGIYE